MGLWDSTVGRLARRLSRAPAPPLGRAVQRQPSIYSPGYGLSAGSRYEEWGAQWLGPYTPSYVPDWVRKLMRRDSQVKLGLIAVKSPFSGIDYRVSGGTPESRAFVEATILRAPVWQKLIRVALQALDFGRQAAELVWTVGSVSYDPDGPLGDSPAVRRDLVYSLADVRDLDPERTTITTDEWGDYAGVRYAGVFLPPDRCALAVHRPEFGSLLGEAVVDSAYHYWWWKNLCHLFAMRFWEKKADPPTKGFAPPGDTQDASGAAIANAKIMADELMSLRNGSVCVLPSEWDPQGRGRLWDAETMPDGGRPDSLLQMLHYLGAMILRSLYVPERIATQDSTVGSFAMVRSHVDVFLGFLEEIKLQLVLPFLDGVAALAVRFGLGADVAPPRFAASEISRDNRELTADLVKSTLNVEHQTADGTVFTAASLIDIPRALRGLNIPVTEPRRAVRGETAVGVALTGIQVESLRDVIASVGKRELPPDAAIELLAVAFPAVPRERVERMVQAAAEGPMPDTGQVAAELALPEPAPTADELASYPESCAAVARRYGVSQGTVRRWAAAGAPALRLPGGRHRFGADLDAWIAEQRTAAAAAPGAA